MGKSEGSYRTFGGFHDGIRMRISSETGDAVLVALHESMHERIFRETADGQLYQAIRRGLEDGTVPERYRAGAARLAGEIWQTSLRSHEVFATYMSIKFFPLSEEAYLQAELTPLYRNYYMVLKSLIDPVISSSYLQYLYAWNLGVAVFSSGLLERLDSVELCSPREWTLNHSEKSDARLDQLLGKLQAVGLVESLDRVARATDSECRRLSCSPWDIQSESGWVDVPPIVANTVERAISDALRTWLSVDVAFPFLTNERHLRAFEHFAHHAYRLFGQHMATMASITPAEIDAELFGEVALASKSRVINASSISQLLPVSDRVLIDGGVLHLGTQFVVCQLPSSEEGRHWALLVWLGDPNTPADLSAQITDGALFAFLKRWIDARDRHETKMIPYRVLAIAHDWPEAARIAQTVLATDNDIGSSLCIYWMGSVVEMYRPLFDEKHALHNVSIGRMDFREVQDDSKPWRHAALVAACCDWRVGASVFRFIRFYPAHVYATVARFHRELRDRKLVHDMTEDQLSTIRPFVNTSAGLVQTLWAEY